MTLVESFRSKSKCFRLRHAVILPGLVVLALHRQLTSELRKSDSFQPFELPFSPSLNASTTRIYEEITFTNYGWFQPDEQNGLQVGRSWIAREFMDAVIVNERFNSSAWQDLNQNPDSSRPILAFVDIDTCNYLHYPRFGQDWKMASDREGGREHIMTHNESFAQVCPMIERALQSPAMSAPESRLVVLSCEGHGPLIASKCTSGNRDENIYSKLVVGHLSAHKDQVHQHDFGIPPMPVKSVVLNETQLDDIQSCRAVNKSYFFSFTGRSRLKFKDYKRYWQPLHGKNGVHAVFTNSHYNQNNVSNAWGGKVLEALPPENQTQDLYYKLLMESVFAGAPRGDNLYSVRFSEILSAATIPVLYSDGWVLPYNKDVVDWSDLAVLLPEKNVSQTMDILQSMSEQDICQRQQRIVEFYKNYMADSRGRLRAVLKIMDARLNQASHEITNLTAASDH